MARPEVAPSRCLAALGRAYAGFKNGLKAGCKSQAPALAWPWLAGPPRGETERGGAGRAHADGMMHSEQVGGAAPRAPLPRLLVCPHCTSGWSPEVDAGITPLVPGGALRASGASSGPGLGWLPRELPSRPS